MVRKPDGVMRRTRPVGLLDLAIATWVNTGRHLAIPEDYLYPDDVTRVVIFQQQMRGWAAPCASPSPAYRHALLQRLARFSRGEYRIYPRAPGLGDRA